MNKWWVVILVIVVAVALVHGTSFGRSDWSSTKLSTRFSPEAAGSAQILVSWTFHSVLHPTDGTATVYRLGDGRRIFLFSPYMAKTARNFHWQTELLSQQKNWIDSTPF